MKLGTKSLLFGAHCFFVHPFCVLIAWIKIYGFPFDPRIWIAILVHDWGYWGKPDMDGLLGKMHPYLGAKIMRSLFGEKWYWFTLLHSRFMAREYDLEVSKLCYADKLSIKYELKWFYSLRVKLSGEYLEYFELMRSYRRQSNKWLTSFKKRQNAMSEWFDWAKGHMISFVEDKHK